MATGTDEHGLKIQQAARTAGLGEQEFTRQLSARFKVRFLVALAFGTLSFVPLGFLGQEPPPKGPSSPSPHCDPIN